MKSNGLSRLVFMLIFTFIQSTRATNVSEVCYNTIFTVMVKHRNKSTTKHCVLLCTLKMEHPPCQSRLAQEEACLFRSSSDMSVKFITERSFYTFHL